MTRLPAMPIDDERLGPATLQDDRHCGDGNVRSFDPCMACAAP